MEDKKVKVNYTVSEQLIEKFYKISKENAINKSALIEILLTEWIKKFEGHGK